MKRATPMKLNSSTNAWLKKTYQNLKTAPNYKSLLNFKILILVDNENRYS